MQPLFEHRLEVGGYRTRALELEGDGPPLLLLHGWADSADTWRLLLDRLAREGRAALALDMPGFGTADRLGDGPILEQLDAFVDGALEHIGEETVIVGNSLGGCAGLRAAERHELGGVVAVAPAGLDMARWFVLVRRDPLIRNLLASPLPVPNAITRRVVAGVYSRLAFHRPAEVDPRIAQTFAGHLESRSTAARVVRSARRLLPELDDCFQLDRIGCPVLLVWGREDLLVFQTGAERVLDAVPGSRLEVIDDCGHCPQLERPDRLGDLVLGFSRSPASL
jgi:pimeloyl-ACP methyl ester carboxylesterase